MNKLETLKEISNYSIQPIEGPISEKLTVLQEIINSEKENFSKEDIESYKERIHKHFVL